MPPKQIFHTALSRSLAMIDQNPLSRSYGCCDRNFWHYQDGKGFSVGSFQMAMLGFFGGAKLFKEEQTTFTNACDAALQYWAKLILKNGSLSEYYYGQESFCATAQTTMAALCILATQARESQPLQEEVIEASKRALQWLGSQTHRPNSTNQELAARIAWDLAFDIPALRSLASEPNPFCPKPSPEGWFPEYEGFDLAYSLNCLDLCAFALGLLKQDEKRAHYKAYAHNLINFLHLTCVHFTFAPVLSSRENPLRLLGGLFAFMQTGNTKAKEVYEKLLKMETLVSEENTDDKYLAFFHLSSLMVNCFQEDALKGFFPFPIQTHNNIESLPAPDFLDLKDAGLIFYRQGTLKTTVALKKGGAVVVDDGTRIASHGGYALLMNGKQWATSHLKTTASVTQDSVESTLSALPVSERLRLVQHPGFQILLKFAMNIPGIRRLLNRWILDRVNSTQKTSITIGKRTIQIEKHRIKIEDTFNSNFETIAMLSNWCMKDGHTTRQFSTGLPTIEKMEPIQKGKIIHFEYVEKASVARRWVAV